MPNLNKVILMGHLTRDPESRTIPTGQVITSIGIAINRSFIHEGQKREDTTFVDCEAFGKTAESIARFFKKGRAIFIEGRLRQDSWVDKQTKEKRYKMMVAIESFTFVDDPGRSTDNRAKSEASEPSRSPVEEDDSNPFA